jgi:hypothetical protein
VPVRTMGWSRGKDNHRTASALMRSAAESLPRGKADLRDQNEVLEGLLLHELIVETKHSNLITAIQVTDVLFLCIIITQSR